MSEELTKDPNEAIARLDTRNQMLVWKARAETAEARMAELEAENVRLSGRAMCEGERANEAEAERDAMRANLSLGDRVGPNGAYIVAPVEPTSYMLARAFDVRHVKQGTIDEIWFAMLSTLQGGK